MVKKQRKYGCDTEINSAGCLAILKNTFFKIIVIHNQ